MSRVIRRRWSGDFTAPTRAGNKSCEYEAYVPDSLVGRNIVLSGEVAADVADAEAAIAQLNESSRGWLSSRSGPTLLRTIKAPSVIRPISVTDNPGKSARSTNGRGTPEGRCVGEW